MRHKSKANRLKHVLRCRITCTIKPGKMKCIVHRLGQRQPRMNMRSLKRLIFLSSWQNLHEINNFGKANSKTKISLRI